MSVRNSSTPQGFTLLEMLVATMLLSVVLGSAYTLFYSTLSTWKSVERGQDPYREVRNALTLFERETECLVAQAGHLFEGESDEVTMFILAAPMNVEAGEGKRLLRVRYYLDKSKDRLMREEALVEAALPKRPPADKELDRTRIKLTDEEKFVVASSVTDFTVKYYWIPRPEFRDYEEPPEPMDPVILSKHKERWGLPQGIEVEVAVENPGESEPYRVRALAPVRTENFGHTLKSLEDMLGAYL